MRGRNTNSITAKWEIPETWSHRIIGNAIPVMKIQWKKWREEVPAAELRKNLHKNLQNFWKVRSPPWDVEPKLHDFKSRNEANGVVLGESLGPIPRSKEGGASPVVTQGWSIFVEVQWKEAEPVNHPRAACPLWLERSKAYATRYRTWVLRGSSSNLEGSPAHTQTNCR